MWLHPAGRSSKTLVKYSDLRIVLIAMKANTRMHEHTAAGRISVHVLNGHIRLQLPERVVDLPAGHLLALDQCAPHDVEAAEESALSAHALVAAGNKNCGGEGSPEEDYAPKTEIAEGRSPVVFTRNSSKGNPRLWSGDGQPGVISSPVGLVPTNALIATNSRIVGNPEIKPSSKSQYGSVRTGQVN